MFRAFFPFFSRDFRGSVGIKNPCFFFFWWFPCRFPEIAKPRVWKPETPGFHKSPPPPSHSQERPPPLLVWECTGVRSTMERPVLASFGRGSGWQFTKTRGFLTRGFAIPGFSKKKRKEGQGSVSFLAFRLFQGVGPPRNLETL